MTFAEWFMAFGYNTTDVVEIQWPEEEDEDQTPQMKLSCKHFADPPDMPRRTAYVDIPPEVTIGPDVLNVAFLRGKVLKPCPKCHTEKKVEVLATTGPWDGRSTVYDCHECGKTGYVQVNEDDLNRRKTWQKEWLS